MRFYFDLDGPGEAIIDRKGVEAASLDEALHEAQSVLTEFLVDAPSRLYAGWTLLVRDRGRRTIARMELNDRRRDLRIKLGVELGLRLPNDG